MLLVLTRHKQRITKPNSWCSSHYLDYFSIPLYFYPLHELLTSRHDPWPWSDTKLSPRLQAYSKRSSSISSSMWECKHLIGNCFEAVDEVEVKVVGERERKK